MKTGYSKYWSALVLFMGLAFIASPANAVGTLIVAAIYSTTSFTFAMTLAATAINIAVSMIVAKNAASGLEDAMSGASQNPGNRQSAPPATNNKLPVIYGSAWTGGTVTDMSISDDNQWMFYVIALSEVTDNGNDVFTFGDIYFSGKKVVFDSTDLYKVAALQDPSTLIEDTSVAGNLYIYLYNNGTNSNINSPYSANTVINGDGAFNINITYNWTTAQQMSNCAFAIVQMKYSQQANLTGFQQMKFQLNNPRSLPGDCFYDYLTNTVYGAGVNDASIDTDSLDELNEYCAASFEYKTYSGNMVTQQRFQFNGVVDTNRSIIENMQEMATSCDCLIKYNEILGQWGVIVQKPITTTVMDINDSLLIGSLSINPLDIANSYNIIECKFPDSSYQDSFNVATFDLAQIAPTLLYPNEPINKQSVTLSLVNNNITAQYIANRLLEANREDLSVTCKIDYQGLQLEAGDIVSLTNVNYGWSAKLFRVNKVSEQFATDGAVTADLILTEYNPQVYDDKNITQFTPSPNTSLPNALIFGTLFAPTITGQTPAAPVPYFFVTVTTPNNGISQYAELYYSASNTGSGLIFAGTTAIRPSGEVYEPGTTMPPVTITGVPSGDWYFYYKIVNDLGTSALSLPSSILYWRPMTFQYAERYLMIAYANNSTGTSGFSFNPRSKSWFGIHPSDSQINSVDPTDYTWFPASPSFGTTFYLLYSNWGNNSVSYAVGTADYYAGTGNFVSTSINYDGGIWSGVVDPVLDPVTGTYPQSFIDLSAQSGQIIVTGSTKNYGSLDIRPNTDGRLQVALNKFISFGTDASGAEILQKTVAPALLTVDIYGRVVGFQNADNFYVTIKNFQVSLGQTVFNTTRAADYVAGNCLVFQNGILVDTSEYTDSAGSTGNVTFTTARTVNDIITICSFRSYHLATAGSFIIGKTYTIVSLGSGTDWNAIGYVGTPAVGGVFVATGAGSGTGTASNIYDSFSRFTQNVTNQSIIDPTNAIISGYEYIFFNGVAMLDPDYDIVGENISNMPANMTGQVTVIQWSMNNISNPNGNPYVVYSNTVAGNTSYTFGLTPYAFNLFENGVMLINGTANATSFSPNDYTTTTGGYILGTTPTSSLNFLLQQSFTSAGAA